jgi:outer membrane protein assembly factor BamB
VQEDESRYQVTLRRADLPDSWSGEVTGRPTLYPLSTVNVLTANKEVVVFDKANKKLWQSTLNFNLSNRATTLATADSPYGQGPCVEHQGSLYVFDQGVLTAFDLATGTARWRLPSIGIAGLFFDDQGMMYVNTTTASLDSLKFSNQIDITRKDVNVVLKLDPRTGKTLWSAQPGGLLHYVSGKFLYALYAYPSDEDDEEGRSPYSTDAILGRRATFTIKRLNPANGHLVWVYSQDRYPYDVAFDRTTIRLVFKDEAQVLKFFSF